MTAQLLRYLRYVAPPPASIFDQAGILRCVGRRPSRNAPLKIVRTRKQVYYSRIDHNIPDVVDVHSTLDH